MNMPNLLEVKIKHQRVNQYLEENNYDAMLLGTQEHFAWFTDGGDSRVILNNNRNFGLLVIKKEQIFLIAQTMDGQRILDEELRGLDIEPVFISWKDVSREEKALELLKGLKVVSDLLLPGVDFKEKDIFKLHWPLTKREINKLKWLGSVSENVLKKVALKLQPGMTEYEVEALLYKEFAKLNVQCDVLLVGSDERIFKYRHPNPSDKVINSYVMLHPAIRKWGLHCNVTRLVHFGSVPEEIETRYEAVSRIQATAIGMCREGVLFSDIYRAQECMYSQLGYKEDWLMHYHGGLTGYMVSDPFVCMDEETRVKRNQAFDWFITITGVKSEELVLNEEGSIIIPSVTGLWPTSSYTYEQQSYQLPSVLEL